MTQSLGIERGNTMTIRNTPTRWGGAARFFHWVGALAIFFLLFHGLWMTHFAPRPERLPNYALHASIGYVLIAFTLARLLWRGTQVVPELATGTPRWERLAAQAGHWGLYLFTFATAFTGWALAGTMRTPLHSVFGLFNMPGLMNGRAWHDALEDIHQVLAWSMGALVLVHIASAVWHWLWRKDDIMRRMI
jgi:cytochrome b561